VASHALSIFGDHQDVMACRQTGFAFLASTNPQEVMHLGAAAHLAAIKGRVPFVHFFDGFRTSHEMQKIDAWDYDELADMLDMDAVQAFRDRALNPEHPVLRGTAQNPDIFFQAREACNPYYDALPGIVEDVMSSINKKAGTDYKLFNYYGAPDADRVIVAMGSVVDTIEETIDYMLDRGEKVGLIKVRLYRPFASEKFVAAIPKTVKKIAVLDRTKEPGSLGEPLYLDVMTALSENGVSLQVVGGRYGLGSKDVPPSNILAVFKNLENAKPKNKFTVGITDDLTNLSLPLGENPDTSPKGTVSCKFWGLGADGTVGANHNTVMIIGDQTDKYAQAYFAYDSKKAGGVTRSHLRFGDKPIKSTYFIANADFVACHNPSYVDKYKMVEDIKPGGTFLLCCDWDIEELGRRLPGTVKRFIANNDIKLFTIDGIGLARGINKRGLGVNVILQAAFFKLAMQSVIPLDDAVKYMKDAIVESYGSKGQAIVDMNWKCVDTGLENVNEISVPDSWKTAPGDYPVLSATGSRPELVEFVNDILIPVNALRGDDLPVSAFKDADGTLPQGSAAYEKRCIAVDVPEWIPENCNQCAYVCPHAVIRPFVLNDAEAAAAPANVKTLKMSGKGLDSYKYSITASPSDCTGCNICANVCPSKEKALVMKPIDSQMEMQGAFEYLVNDVSDKPAVFDTFKATSVKGSQFKQPLLEFSGACRGCGETPYAKLMTQLFGDRMYIGNATGCSSIWGGSAPATPYTVNKCGKGPAWANSLFEDTAEFSLGFVLAVEQRREKLALVLKPLADAGCPEAKEWIENMHDGEKTKEITPRLKKALEGCAGCGCDADSACKEALAAEDMFVKKSIWAFGGDGWAYDIGFGGLDHVIASGQDINLLVFDTEVYSNTGGQASKASQIGQVAQFAAAGKEQSKKDLAQIAMSYGSCYVAQVAMGADYNQTIKAFVEAESYKGPSIIIAYAPCRDHIIAGGLDNMIGWTKEAVEAGYWHNFRFDPRLRTEGKNPFQMDSKAPTKSYKDFLKGEGRYKTLELQFPDRAKELFDKAEKEAQRKYKILTRYAKLFED
jgi:pyruvate-ferredoxin/flavodoxin oxidoreductase